MANSKNQQQNISNSILLMGPSGVGKSLIAGALSQKTNLPLLDIDDLINFIESDLMGGLIKDEEIQKDFINFQIEDLKKVEREIPLTPEESKKEESLVYELVDLYNYYHDLLGGYEQFYQDYFDFRQSKCITKHDQVYSMNKLTYQILNKVYESTNTPFVISPPASFGWETKNPLHFNLKFLQDKVGNFLDSTQTILLEPGQDYHLRSTTDKTSVNDKLLLKHLDGYYEHADIVISTNALFNDPENEFLQQRTWLNVRETLTKEQLKNTAEIDNICDQILEFTQTPIQNINTEITPEG